MEYGPLPELLRVAKKVARMCKRPPAWFILLKLPLAMRRAPGLSFDFAGGTGESGLV